MACYSRYLQEVMKKAGAEVNEENKKFLEEIVREVLEMEKVPCEDLLKKIQEIYTSPDMERKAGFEKEVTRLLIKRLITG